MDERATNSWVGRTLGGRYQILEPIGEGGMGVVYRARQLSVDREVAIKMMHARAAQDPQWTERFQSEAKACSLLTHPNTIRLYDFGQTTRGNFYMVMELLRGSSLSDVIQREAPMPSARVLRILMQCCASLSEAHKTGIIHRDIKPENIWILELEGTTDFVKLFDFSIAKRSDVSMTATGMIMGTPQFMSPEQGRGEAIDLRSDLYSLGVVAYAMLSGQLPFNDADPLEVLRMHQTMAVPPLPAHIPNSVAKLVMSCLDKSPARRPASAPALLEASRIWLTEIDPTLDVSSDPVLKNTLVTGGPTVDMPAPGPTYKRAAPNAKTMLGAAGASPPRLARTSVSDGPPVAMQPAETRDSKQRMIQSPSGGLPAQRQPSDRSLPLKPSPAPNRAPLGVVSHGAVPAASRTPPRESNARAQTPDLRNPTPPTALPSSPVTGEQLVVHQSSTAGFLVICLLVALTFGFGGYFWAATLR